MNQYEQVSQALREAETTYLAMHGWIATNARHSFWYPSQRIGDIYPREASAVGTAEAIAAQRQFNFERDSIPVPVRSSVRDGKVPDSAGRCY